MQSHAPESSVQKQLFVHFGLRENPFGGTPDPRFLFHSETHREALASLVNGIGCEFGFQVLVAQPGMGKTTLLFNFLERFRETAHTAFLFQPQLEPHELLQSLLLELGVVSEDTSVRKLSEQINQVLGSAAKEHKRVIVVVDEAQNLDFAVLEALRQLSNFETAQSKLMQIILAGQPELVRKLAAPEQEQLRQRISTISRLSPLTFNETRAYINHRLRTAGYRGSDIFNLEAARHIWENSKGVPRKINTLCFNAMLLAFAGNTKFIDEAILDEAARDLDMPSVLADIYRTEPPPPAVSPHVGNANGHGKTQAIRETRLPETESSKPSSQAAVQRSLLQKVELTPASASSGDGSRGGAGENLPPALVEAIVRISQTLEEQKVLLAAKSASVAEPLAASASGLASTTTLAPVAAATITAPVTSGGTSPRSAGAVSAGKESPPQREKTVSSDLKPASSGSTPQLGTAKPSEGWNLWAKALALVAVTSILTFVVVDKTLSQHPAQADASESGASGPEQSNSSGYSVPRGSPASPMDAPLRPSKDSGANGRARRTSVSDEGSDVIVRKFPAEPAAASGTPSSNSVYFEQDSAAIDEQYHVVLQEIADALAKDPQASAIIEGHTDDTGAEGYNIDLSSRRAIAVREALINEFNVPSTQLTAIGSGSSAPIRPNSTAVGRAYNRRAAVRFVRLGE